MKLYQSPSSTTFSSQQYKGVVTRITHKRCMMALIISCLIVLFQLCFMISSTATTDTHQQHGVMPDMMMMGRALSETRTNNNNDNLSFCCLIDEERAWSSSSTTSSSSSSRISSRSSCSKGTSTICKRRLDDTNNSNNNNNNNNNKNAEQEQQTTRRTADGRKKLTVALMYYAEPAMLLRQLENFMSYPETLRQRIILLIVDDGSPVPSLTASTYITQHHRSKLLDIQIAYIQQNVPWNTPGARNLAFHVATTESVLMIDSDLLIPVATMEMALTWPTKRPRLASPSSSSSSSSGGENHQHHPGYIAHQFNRTKPSGEYKVHPSAMLMDVAAFWETGGFEEDFSGHYGMEDVAFMYRFRLQSKRNRHMEHGRAILTQFDEADPCSESILLKTVGIDKSLVASCRQGRESLPPLPRQTQINKAKFERRRISDKWSNLYLRFPWTMVVKNDG